MDSRVSELLDSVSRQTLEKVVQRIFDDSSAEIVAGVDRTEITSPHADQRTIAILKYSGSARSRLDLYKWSAVVKVIDLSAGGGAAQWVDPRLEESVYKNELFSSLSKFRAVKCYLIEQRPDGLKFLWLEDLSDQRGAPFDFDELTEIARDVGEFNGAEAVNPTPLPFEPEVDRHLLRWTSLDYTSRMAALRDISDAPDTKRMYKSVDVTQAIEMHSLLDRQVQQSVRLPHSIAFGDCQPGNVFLTESGTVAIDWASVSCDPTGVDAGVLVGSSMMWGGENGIAMVKRERELFDSYVGGLVSSGWVGNTSDVRRAYLTQFGVYLMIAAAMPASRHVGFYKNKEFLEKRFQRAFDDIPELLVPIIEEIPKYTEELRSQFA